MLADQNKAVKPVQRRPMQCNISYEMESDLKEVFQKPTLHLNPSRRFQLAIAFLRSPILGLNLIQNYTGVSTSSSCQLSIE